MTLFSFFKSVQVRMGPLSVSLAVFVRANTHEVLCIASYY